MRPVSLSRLRFLWNRIVYRYYGIYKQNSGFHVKEPSVISFGKFDGLHRGHEFLMEKQIEQSNLHGYKRIIFTFDIPPKSEVLGVESKVIITNDEKEYVFENQVLTI